MFNIPDRYKMDIKVNIKDFIPKDLKPEQKKRIRESLKSVILTHQIAGEEIPSVMDNEYRCQVVQFYDFTIQSIKDAAFLAGLYQSIIKSLCVIRLHDAVDEVYSFSLKRLNQQDESQIVINDNVFTEAFPVGLPNRQKDRMSAYIDYDKVINKTDKLCFYKEIFDKVYMIKNEKAYSDTQVLLDGVVWYDAAKTERMFRYYKELVDKRILVKKVLTNAEKVKINQEIKETIMVLNTEKY